MHPKIWVDLSQALRRQQESEKDAMQYYNSSLRQYQRCGNLVDPL